MTDLNPIDPHTMPEPTGEGGNAGEAPAISGAEPSPADTPEAGTPGTGFQLTDRGVWSVPDDGEPRWICSPLYVTALTRNQHGEAWGRLLEFQDRDGQWKCWPCPMELLAGDGTEFRRTLLSLGLEIAPGSTARNALATYVQTARVDARAVCTERTGWHGPVYVLPDETIGDSGNERILLQVSGEPPRLRQSGDCQAWRDNIGTLCHGNSRLTLAVSAAFAAPLAAQVGEESGGIHLVGQSSSGKTTVLRVGTSVWGGPEYLKRWRATANGLEAVATAHNDGLLILDELAQVDAREAGSIAYMLANGTGKQRAQRDGMAKSAASWRLLFLSAGEVGLADHMREAGKRARAGQEVRLADIPADTGSGSGAFEALHGYASGAALADVLNQASGEQYGAPIREYLRQLTNLGEGEVREKFQQLRTDFIDKHVPEGADGQAQRVAGRFALVATGGELATRLGLTGWSVGDAIEAAGTCFRDWLDRRGGAGSREDAEALAAVRHFLESYGDGRFSAIHDRDARILNRAGYRRQGERGTEFLILPETFKQEVCAGLDHQRVARVLRDRGLLITEAGRLNVKTSVGRCYVVTEDIHA